MSRSSTARAAVPSISIVVAVRDEAVTVRLLFAEVASVLDALEGPAEVGFVDDDSTDDSGDVICALLRLDARVRRVCRMRAVGLSAALHVGFRAARGEVVVTLDADLQNDPRDIPKILGALQYADVVVGWRFHRHDPWHRRISSAVANRVRNAVTGEHIRDSGCGLRALSLLAVRWLLSRRLAYAVKVGEIPASWSVPGLTLYRLRDTRRER